MIFFLKLDLTSITKQGEDATFDFSYTDIIEEMVIQVIKSFHIVSKYVK